MSTHINNDAKFAKTVLMPGDPLRAKYIAEHYLKDYKEVTSVRGILGYTGKTSEGKEISVMASGMVFLQLVFIHMNYLMNMELKILFELEHVALIKKKFMLVMLF